MRPVRIDLIDRDFDAQDRHFARFGEFSLSGFRFPLGVAALRLSNSVGHITVLPFQGQQIWDAEFFGRRLTMDTIFDQPRPTQDFLKTYGAFLIHCGISAVGPASPENSHPPHGELPNAAFEMAAVEFGVENGREYAVILGRYSHKLAFHSDYSFDCSITMRSGSGRLDVGITVANHKNTAMELMYLAHANFKASAGVRIEDNANGIRIRKSLPTHVTPSKPYLALLDQLEDDPQRHRTIHAADAYDPEVVLYLEFDEADAWCVASHVDGTADFIRWSRQELPHAVRWISRTPDQECLGLALPGTAHPEGLVGVRRKGQAITLDGGRPFAAATSWDVYLRRRSATCKVQSGGNMATLDLLSVGKSFGAVQILKDINLHVRDGSFVVLVGPSGCGKSTLLRMICGLEKVSAGELHIDGRRVNELAPSDRDIAMVFQSYALYPNLSVAKNMAFPLEMRKVDRREIAPRVDKAARMLGLTDLMDRLPKQLSGGQRQRVAMGRAIVRDPKVFLFDEPLSNLDAKMRVQMRTEIRELHQELRTTTVYVTHDQIEAMTMADVVVLMNQGRIEQAGSPLELYDSPANRFVAGFIGSPGMNFVDGIHDLQTGSVELGEGIRIAATNPTSRPGTRNVTLGFRPEHATFGTKPIEGAIPTILKLVEPTGATTQLVLQWRDQELILSTPERASFQPGERVYVNVPASASHLFDAGSGVRVTDAGEERVALHA